MNNVMVDLETLDTRPTAVILSIGAVFFDRCDVDKKRFYRVVDQDSCIVQGLTTSASTVTWWAKQSKEARSIFTDIRRREIKEVLTAFTDWLPYGVKVWGNGASFDNAVLANAYAACGMEAPWEYWNDRCYRTVVCNKPRRVQKGTHHNALDDAISQAEHMIQVAPEAII